MKFEALILVTVGALVAAGCSSPIRGGARLDRDEIGPALEQARSVDLSTADSKELAKVVGKMLAASRSRELGTDERVAVQQLLEDGCEELATRGENPAHLEDLALVDLPARIAVPAAARAAQLYFDRGDRRNAVSLIRRVDLRYPSHAYREEIGSLLSAIGDSYANDKGRRWLLFTYEASAIDVYEYLSTEYPSHPDSDDALVALATRYEDNRRFQAAIDRHRDLVLWSPNSPFRPASEAAIPRLRLADLDGPEYGRDQMLVALDELEHWVEVYGIHPLRPEVDRTRVDCLQRLADNDLVVAEFYRTVRSPEGARQHASRALEFAQLAGNPQQLAEIRGFLESVDEIERVDAPIIVRDTDPGDVVGRGPTDVSAPAQLAPSSPTEIDDTRSRRTDDDDEDDQEPGTEIDLGSGPGPGAGATGGNTEKGDD